MINLSIPKTNLAGMHAAVLGLLLLQACGGPGAPSSPAGESTAPVVLPGIEGSGFVSARLRGTVDGFGSVYVNGVRYSTGAALLFADSTAVDESQLRVGQIVTLDVRRSEDGAVAEALRVEQAHAVVGCIEAIDVGARQLVVAGQTIATDAATLFGASLSRGFDGGFADGAAVAVSARLDEGNALRATRIDAQANCDAVQVSGRPHSLDVSGATFSVGALRVDYSAVRLLDVTREQLAAGSAIVVTGSVQDDVLVAKTLRRESPLAWEQGPVEVEAIVSGVSDGEALEFGADRVLLDAATQFQGERPGLGDLARVTARVVGGALVAETVQRVDPPLHRLRGAITRNPAAGTLEVAGFLVTFDARTRFHDPADPRLSAARLAAGDVVSVRGTPGGAAGVLHAAVVVRGAAADADDSDDDDEDDDRDDAAGTLGERVVIRSVVDAVGRGNLSMLGRSITIDSDTEFDDVSRHELAGQFAFVEARYRAGELVAREVQADGNDDLDD